MVGIVTTARFHGHLGKVIVIEKDWNHTLQNFCLFFSSILMISQKREYWSGRIMQTSSAIPIGFISNLVCPPPAPKINSARKLSEYLLIFESPLFFPLPLDKSQPVGKGAYHTKIFASTRYFVEKLALDIHASDEVCELFAAHLDTITVFLRRKLWYVLKFWGEGNRVVVSHHVHLIVVYSECSHAPLSGYLAP